MSSSAQTWIALFVVAVAAAWLVFRAIAKRKNPGCGDECGAVSPEIKRLQRQLEKKR